MFEQYRQASAANDFSRMTTALIEVQLQSPLQAAHTHTHTHTNGRRVLSRLQLSTREWQGQRLSGRLQHSASLAARSAALNAPATADGPADTDSDENDSEYSSDDDSDALPIGISSTEDDSRAIRHAQ